MVLSGIVLAVILIAAVAAVAVTGILDKNREEAVMEEFCKDECVCCQKRP